LSRPRILHLITSTGVGGAETALGRLVRGLGDRYRFEVISLKPVGETGERLRRDGVMVTGLDAGGAGLVRGAFRLWREVGRRRPDLVHAWLFQANLLGRLAAAPRSIPNISSIRTLEKERTWQLPLDAVTHPLADRYLAVSGAAARFTAEHGVPAGKIRVVPNGLEPEAFEAPPEADRFRARHGIPQEAFLVVCAGRLRWEKGQSVLLEAITEATGGRDTRLLLAGTGPDEERLRQRALDLGLEDKVVFAGLIEDMRPAYRCADVLALPSLWEGMPNAVLEAMAQSTPAVASEVGGVPEVVADRETGLLVPPGDAQALAGALVRLREDDQGRRSMGEAALERARTVFPIRRTLEATAALYDELLARPV
jgi:glycosyltransferase involved in cell wall biosynthesis